MKILYVCLDNRPCNNLYPSNYLNSNSEFELIKIPTNLLGYKKEAAKLDLIWEFIFENISKVDALVGSIDTLIYGSLLNSRLHQNDVNTLNKYVENLKKLKSLNSKLKIYGFCLIMRTPKYSSSDEEPDYYEQYGFEIYRKKYLLDKKNIANLTKNEDIELTNIKIPNEYVKDYETRRDTNAKMLLKIINLYNEKYIDLLTIPQDDSAKYGYTAIDQRLIFSSFKEKLLTYSGADEAGCSLLARFINDCLNKQYKFYVLYSENNLGNFIPLYEDRNISVNLKSHVEVFNAQITKNIEESDFVICYNVTNEEVMCESLEQLKYESKLVDHNKNLINFVANIKNYIQMGKKVILVDSAYANGGDLRLIKLLKENNLLDKLDVYKGWNTNCNSLGSAISNACLNQISTNENRLKNLALSYYEDVIYQGIVKGEVSLVLDKYNCNYFDISPNLNQVENLIFTQCNNYYNDLIKNSNLDFEFKIYSPWKRMFELGVEVKNDK